MKQLIPIFILFLISLTGCVSSNENMETLEDFKKNHFNLKLTEPHFYGKISYQLSNSFFNNYSQSYTLTNRSKTFYSYTLGIYFTVERFSEQDLNMPFVREQVVKKDLLNTFHDAYTFKRFSTLSNGGVSIKKTLSKPVRFKGVEQVVSGESEYEDGLTYYATATIKVNKEYYVFQWITTNKMMTYVHDDFHRILQSVRKVK